MGVHLQGAKPDMRLLYAPNAICYSTLLADGVRVQRGATVRSEFKKYFSTFTLFLKFVIFSFSYWAKGRGELKG
jgi:hypothetical protein